MDSLAQQAKAAPSYVVALHKAHHLRPPLSRLYPSSLFSPLSSPPGLLRSIAQQLHPIKQQLRLLLDCCERQPSPQITNLTGQQCSLGLKEWSVTRQGISQILDLVYIYHT